MVTGFFFFILGNLVKCSTIKNVWNKILHKEKTDSRAENEECKTIKETGRILSYEENEIYECLNIDIHGSGYWVLNDDEIVDDIQVEK